MSIAVCNFCTAELEKMNFDKPNEINDNWSEELKKRNIFWCKDCLRVMFNSANHGNTSGGKE